MGCKVDTDELIDAQGIADLLGLAQRNTVSLCQRRYPDTQGQALILRRVAARAGSGQWSRDGAGDGGRRRDR